MGVIASKFVPFIQDLIESINWLAVAYFLFFGFSMIAAIVIFLLIFLTADLGSFRN
tara:strand:+ start:358 stop:525 length:168 start_codon:yes stop_codon:yes gene_type:complete